ncbi:MAG TPA: hypothetical protein DF364_06420 [Ruminococcaceae bacterium]|nr:hypothetical protein [Oscillospiraceae bacterium]
MLSNGGRLHFGRGRAVESSAEKSWRGRLISKFLLANSQRNKYPAFLSYAGERPKICCEKMI